MSAYFVIPGNRCLLGLRLPGHLNRRW